MIPVGIPVVLRSHGARRRDHTLGIEMARPERNNVDYFPHPVHNGRKMYVIKKKYGNDGYAVWYQLLEQLGNAKYHYIDLREPGQLMYLAAEFTVSETLLKEILLDLCTLNAINPGLYSEYSIIYSEDFVNSIQDAYEKRKNKCLSLQGLCTLLSIKCPRKPGKLPLTPPEIHKEKKRKEKESIDHSVNSEIPQEGAGKPQEDAPIPHLTDIPPAPSMPSDKNISLFDEARILFPGTKRGLKPEYDNFIKKHKKEASEILPLLIPAIIKQRQWREEQKANGARFIPQWKNFQTWINNQCWTEEPGQQATEGTGNAAVDHLIKNRNNQ